MQPIHLPARRAQRGAASLFVALMLLLGGTIIAFFANRSFIFEQRTSANQYRATKAFELAEAGSEWALGKLNENLPLVAGSSCATGGAATANTFRNRFANPQPSGGSCTATAGCLVVTTAAAPGCRIDNAGVTTCDCPTAAAATLGAAAADEQGRFAVRFAAVPGDGSAVEIISRGCVNTVGNTACDPNSTTVQTDATATVRVIAKIVPSVPSGPAAALTAGSSTVTGGNLNVVNTFAPSNGITIHSGTTVQTGSGTAVYTLPGTPPRASILDNDPSLNSLTIAGEDAFFANFFGQTLTNYRTVDPDVIRIGASGIGAYNCADGGSCGNVLRTILDSGLRNPRIYVDGDVTIDGGNSVWGSPTNFMTVVASGTMLMRSNITAYGLFYAATATATDNWDISGTGTATIYGAFISRGDFNKGSGTLNLVYDPSLWGGTSAPVGRLVKVPGSWRDKLTDY
jgi:Tfp pilus assembly protein PilX